MEEASTQDIQIRLMAKEDEAFVYSTWLRSYKKSSQFAKRITDKIYYQYHHAIIQRILERPTARVYVANPINSPEVILGYLVMEILDKPLVHFVYVKNAFRSLGIGRKLIDHGSIDLNQPAYFTHWTYPMDQLSEQYPSLIYVPYLI